MATYPEAQTIVWWRNGPYVRLSGIMFMSFLTTGLVSPLFAIRAQELGAAFWQIGLITTVSQIASVAVQYLWGRWSDRMMRRKPLLVIGLAGFAVATALVGLVRDYRPLFLVQAFSRFALAAYGIGRLAMIGDVLEGAPNRGQLMGLYRGGGSLAFGLAALFGGKLADLYGTAVPFLLGGCFAGAAFLLGLTISEPRPSSRKTGVGQKAQQPDLRASEITGQQLRWTMPFLLAVFVWFLATNSAFEFWPVYMRGQGFAKTVITQLWGLAALGEAVAMLIAGHLCDRWGSRKVLSVGLVGMGLVFISYVLIPRFPWLILIQLGRSFAYSAYASGEMTYATAMGLRRQRGRMTGLHATATGLGGISGGAVGGTLAEALGVGNMLWLIGLLMAVTGLVAGRTMVDPLAVALAAQEPGREEKPSPPTGDDRRDPYGKV